MVHAGMPNRPTAARPAVSVIIPTYQRRTSVLRLLDALALQDLPAAQFEVIVVVDGSDDGTEEAATQLEQHLPYALTVLAHENRGRARTRNRGIEAACGGVLVMLDDDMEPAPSCLSAHLAAHAAAARRCVIGPAPITVEPDATPSSRYVAWKFNEHLDRLGQPGHEFAIQDFYSGNISVERELLGEVGGFEERFSAYGNEDLELGLRLRRAGIDIVYVPGATARQHHTKTFAALAADARAAGHTAVEFAALHPEALPQLRVGGMHNGPYLWRLLRDAMVAADVRTGLVTSALLWLTEALEHRRITRIVVYYRHVFEFFYWTGARAALAETWARPVRDRLQR
jgi:GT2 family glycosyltransferase